jgi:oligoendopeptidase F
MAEGKTAIRTYVSPKLKVEGWDDVAHHFEELLYRKITSVEDLRTWLLNYSELEAVISEESAWRYIRMTLDTREKEASERYQQFVSDVLPKVEQWTDKLNRRLIAEPWLDNIEGDGFPVMFRGIKGQLEIFREENVTLQAELRALGQEYSTAIGAMSVEWKGEQITLPKAAAILESTDRIEREQIYRLIADRRSRDQVKLDELFDRMLHKRHTVATNAGFTNFRDYMYRSLGRFDHAPEDAMAFHVSVEQEVLPVVAQLEEARRNSLGLEQLRPWDLAVDVSGKPALKPFKDPQQLIDLTVAVFEKLDPYFAGCIRTMQHMGRLDLASREGKAPGGYNYPLYESGSPFIFMNAVGTSDDVITMLHEGGHAVHSFLTHPLPLTGFKSFPSEVAELASMSMELLTMDHWSLIYPDAEDLKRAKRDQLERVLTILPWVATVDSFQHSVYLHPSWTAAQRTEEWMKIHQRFSSGVVDWSGLEHERSMLWQKQLHIFEVPFYYIEYGIAQLGAIGVWRNYKEDPIGAVRKYTDALKLGYTRTLPEIYETAGIKFDLSQEHVRELIGFVRGELEQLL